jgi:hypothetical protein
VRVCVHEIEGERDRVRERESEREISRARYKITGIIFPLLKLQIADFSAPIFKRDK